MLLFPGVIRRAKIFHAFGVKLLAGARDSAGFHVTILPIRSYS